MREGEDRACIGKSRNKTSDIDSRLKNSTLGRQEGSESLRFKAFRLRGDAVKMFNFEIQGESGATKMIAGSIVQSLVRIGGRGEGVQTECRVKDSILRSSNRGPINRAY